MTASVVAGPVLVRVTPKLSPREHAALKAYAELGVQKHAAQHMGISYQTYKNHMTAAYRRLGVTTAIGAFWALGWLSLEPSPAASLADIEARLSAIHAESGALLAELRSAA